jgi:hypothetical protein
MRTVYLALLTACVAAAASVPEYALFDSVLQRSVLDNGKVRYGQVRNDATLDRFVGQIALVSPDSNPALFPKREDKLAYWINAYNALVLRSFATDYPDKRKRLGSLLGRANFFYRIKHNVGGRMRSLDDIEVNSLRKPLHDPRIHFAIVCASGSCPWLSRHAYTPENVNAKLDEEAKRYWAQARNFALDRASHTVTLPAILDWFKEDFGSTPDKVLAFVARYRPAEAADLTKGTWNIRYFDYDWSPNDAP